MFFDDEKNQYDENNPSTVSAFLLILIKKNNKNKFNVVYQLILKLRTLCKMTLYNLFTHDFLMSVLNKARSLLNFQLWSRNSKVGMYNCCSLMLIFIHIFVSINLMIKV